MENIDSDECMDTDIQTPSDILAFQLRRVIQEKDQEIQKKDKKIEQPEALVLKLKVKLADY